MSAYEMFDSTVDDPIQNERTIAERIGAYFVLNPSPEGSRKARTLAWESAVIADRDDLATYTNPYVRKLCGSLIEYGATNDDAPAMTIAVPVAINHESPKQLETVFTQIEKAATDVGTVNVLVWANAKYAFSSFEETSENKRRTITRAKNNYASLQDILAKRSSNAHYYSGLQVERAGHMRMSDIRFTQMSVLLALARSQGLAAEHPIMWVDADTTFISRNAFTNTAELLGSAPFAHPTLQYSAEWAANVPTTDSARAFMLDEIIDREWRKAQGPSPDQYPEESGLAFTLDAYLKAYGVSTAGPMNEAGGLIARFAKRSPGPDGKILAQKDCLAYDSASRIIISGRRAISLTRNYSHVGLAAFRQSTAPYYLWSETSEQQRVCSNRRISAQVMLNVNQSKLDALPAGKRRLVERIAERLWSSPVDEPTELELQTY